MKLKNWFLATLVVLSTIGCSTFPTIMPGQIVEEKHDYISGELHRIFFSEEYMDTDPENFHRVIFEVYEDVTNALHSITTAPDDIEQHRHVYEMFSRLLRSNLPQIEGAFNASVNQLYQDHRGKYIVIGESKYASDMHYVESEEELFQVYYERYPRVAESFQYIEDILFIINENDDAVRNRIASYEHNALFDHIESSYGITLDRSVRVRSLQEAAVFQSYSSERLYSLAGFSQMQSIGNGLLISTTVDMHTFIFFLETTARYPDGYRFSSSDYVYIDGIFEYQSLLGNRTVYRLIHIANEST